MTVAEALPRPRFCTDAAGQLVQQRGYAPA